MPSYTIQAEPPPWTKSKRVSAVPSSIYSDDLVDSAMADGEISPLSVTSASYHAHPRQEILDAGPPNNRHSRLPIFRQVRTMLTKPGAARWDDLSGEPSDTGRPSQVKPSTYTSPWEGAFQARRHSPDRKTTRNKKNLSPVSVLRDEEIEALGPLDTGRNTPRSVSPVSAVSTSHSFAPSQLSVNAVSRLPPGVNVKNQVKRKPVRSSLSPSASENIPPQQQHHDLKSVQSQDSIGRQEPDSRFSWSTVAHSIVTDLSRDFNANRQSTDTMATRKGLSDSRFSWSTVATNTTYALQDENTPPSPVPPIPEQYLQPTQYSTPPMQSILSRKRPVQRLDQETYTPSVPSPRALSAASPNSSRATTPVPNAASTATPTKIITTPDPASGAKALPLPPFMNEKQANHLEFLLTQEKNLLLQRRNIEKAIADLEKVEKASPLEVSFATVRDAKRRLEERRAVLSEVKKEEMEMGIKIARARRKEDFGEGEGTLWVRRVTR